VLETDAAENRKLTKSKSTGRIDGMVALTMAMGIAPLGVTRTVSVYETRGALAF
jgi:phage terminase large subunit-like protein